MTTDLITREEALCKGLAYYFTGELCKNGHVDKRQTKTMRCLTCARKNTHKYRTENRNRHLALERTREQANREKRNQQKKEAGKRYRERYPERKREQCRRWRQNNKERFKEIMRAYYLANGQAQRDIQNERRKNSPEKYREINKKWRERYPEQAAAHSRASKHNRRARDKLVSGKLKTSDVRRLFAESDGSCKACGHHKPLQVDHVVAIANGGTNDFTNLQLLCAPCNQSKGKKDFRLWLQNYKDQVTRDSVFVN